MLADDDEAIRAFAGGVLRNQGYEVIEAEDGVEALELPNRRRGPIHLLLTDWRMPRLGGQGLIRSMSITRPETAVLIMSGNLNGEQPAGVAVLPKPFTPRDLVRKVRDLLSFGEKPVANGT